MSVYVYYLLGQFQFSLEWKGCMVEDNSFVWKKHVLVLEMSENFMLKILNEPYKYLSILNDKHFFLFLFFLGFT